MQKIFKTTLPLLATALFITACNNSGELKETAKPVLIAADFDTTAIQGADFYQYVNGGWMKNNPIPGDEARWGSFNEVDKMRYEILHKILNEATADNKAEIGSNRKKVGNFYFTGMDSVSLNKQGIEPLKEELAMIDGIKDIKGMMSVIAHEMRNGSGPLYGLYAGQDDMNSSKIAVFVTQGGIGMPEKDYYFRTDPKSVELRAQYVALIATILMERGNDAATAKEKAAKIMTFETSLATASMSQVQMRDPYATYHKMTVADLQKFNPSVDWKSHLAEMGITVDTIIVGQPAFFKLVETQMKKTPIDVWKDYLAWNVIITNARYLSDSLALKSFNFYGKALNGTKSMQSRWKRVLNNIDGNMGEALGEEYVKTAFTPEAKKRMNEMIDNMIATFRERIQSNTWMNDSTKTKASTKLDKITRKIGYPDKWRDYSALTIDRSSYVANVLRSNEWGWNYMINKIGKPVDRTEWGMSPQTVNAYYNPANNEIVFPAGILQPPFFDANADDAINYGGIGAVICHEITHGFDDQGCQYDGDGNLKMWWSKSDKANFDSKAKKLGNQFLLYTLLDSMHVDPDLTMGENIADLGGAMIAYAAFKKTKEGQDTSLMEGYTPQQRFFISWTRVWRNNIRPDALISRLRTDYHSPAQVRGIAPITNMADFFTAFNVKTGDAMYRDDSLRVAIW